MEDVEIDADAIIKDFRVILSTIEILLKKKKFNKASYDSLHTKAEELLDGTGLEFMIEAVENYDPNAGVAA